MIFEKTSSVRLSRLVIEMLGRWNGLIEVAWNKLSRPFLSRTVEGRPSLYKKVYGPSQPIFSLYARTL